MQYFVPSIFLIMTLHNMIFHQKIDIDSRYMNKAYNIRDSIASLNWCTLVPQSKDDNDIVVQICWMKNSFMIH